MISTVAPDDDALLAIPVVFALDSRMAPADDSASQPAGVLSVTSLDGRLLQGCRLLGAAHAVWPSSTRLNHLGVRLIAPGRAPVD